MIAITRQYVDIFKFFFPLVLKELTNTSTFTLACFSAVLRRHLNIQVFKALHYPKVLSEFFLRPLKQTTAPTFTALKLFLSPEIVSYLTF